MSCNVCSECVFWCVRSCELYLFFCPSRIFIPLFFCTAARVRFAVFFSCTNFVTDIRPSGSGFLA